MRPKAKALGYLILAVPEYLGWGVFGGGARGWGGGGWW